MDHAMVALATAAVMACGNGAPKRPEKTMSSDVVLKVEHSVDNQPADAVAWGADGIVTADGKAVSVWKGDAPDRLLSFDGSVWGTPTSVTLLADGAIGVAAARFDRSGTLAGDPAALDAALISGLTTRTTSRAIGYRVRTAAWTPDGTRVWVGVEQRLRRGQNTAPDEPHARTLVLDDKLKVVADVSSEEGTVWQSVAARGDTVVTAGGPLSIWKAREATRTAKLAGPPVAMALSRDGLRVAVTDHQGVQVLRADGSEIARWNAGDPSGVAISSDGSWVATGEADRVRLWRLDGATAKLVGEAPIAGLGFAIAFAPDDRHLVVGSSPRHVTVVAIESK
jgi:DNA-binding beta-propeller fold protein YncE